MLNIGIFISEEGYGHAARQIAIQNLLRNSSDIRIIFYCDKLAPFITERIQLNLRDKILFRYFSNSFRLFKDSFGCIDLDQSLGLLVEGTHSSEDQANHFFDECTDLDIAISDSVPFVSLITEKLGIPSISVNHFSWSWYLKKLILLTNSNIVNGTEIVEKSISQYSKFDIQFILPLHFHDDPCISLSNALNLDEFIVSTDLIDDDASHTWRNSILLMDR